MRKSFTIMLAVLLACLCIGCSRTAEPVPTPLTPAATADVIESMPSAAPDASAAVPDASPGMNGGALIGGIAGFVEGKTVEQTDAPDVVNAIQKKYPNATIKSITYATHAGNQVYHVMMDGVADTTEVYVDANGQISPYVAGTEGSAGQTGDAGANTAGGAIGDAAEATPAA